MQALWSRTAQTHSCRCRSCLRAATAVARRTTAAASKRSFKVTDIFTACYSSILAAAAVADAKVKDDRRKEWDRLIAEAKGLPIEKKEEHDPPPTAGKPESDKSSFFVPEKAIPRVWDGVPWTTTPVKDARWTTQLKILDSHVKQSVADPTKRTTNYRPPNLATVEEDWLGDDDPEGLLLPREPKTQLHVSKIEQSIAKLVARLLLQSKEDSSIRNSISSAQAGDDLSEQLKEMRARIEALHYGDTRLPAYSFPNQEILRRERADLHNSLLALLKRTESGRSNIDIVLAKICYNLLVSGVPPGITTYNILIDAFTRLKQYELGELVINSFLFESRYKPNSTTIRLILDHFSAKGDSAGFRATIRRMRGVDGDMRIMRRPLDNLEYPAVQQWALTNKVIHRNGFLTQKVPRNAEIFDSLIQGCLKLADIRSAIRYFRATIREGYEVKSRTLFRIVEACIEALDYKAGNSLLYAILLQWEKGTHRGDGIQYCSLSRYAIYQLLGICRINLDSTQKLPVKASRDALQRMLRHMNLEAIADSVDRFSERISFVEKLVGMKRSQEPMVGEKGASWSAAEKRGSQVPMADFDDAHRRINLAMQILRDAPARQQHHEDRARSNVARARARSIQVFESLLLTKSKDIILMQMELFPISYGSLPPRSRLKYNAAIKEREDIPISERMALLLYLHHEAQQEEILPTGAFDEQRVNKQELLETQFREIPHRLHLPTAYACGSHRVSLDSAIAAG